MEQNESKTDKTALETGQASGRHAIWLAILAPALALFLGLITLGVYASTPLAINGYADFTYGGTLLAEPTASMSQSKVWWNDGSWWGILYNVDVETYNIYRLDAEQQEWIDTGVAVDEREDSRADVLWDETAQKLYVASHAKQEIPGTPNSNDLNKARLYRYSYDTATNNYTLDENFPVIELNRYRSESLVLDKDSTGRLWATWVGRTTGDPYYFEVYVAYTEGDDFSWSNAFRLPFATEANVSTDDISTLVSFTDDEGPKIGVLWSNQLDGQFHFATHSDTENPQDGWTLDSDFAAAVTVPADDHMNFAKTATGELFMALKTGIDPIAQPTEPLIVLVTRESDGTTSVVNVAPGDSRDTRPIVVVNESTNELNLFTVNKTDGEAVCRFTATITSPLSDINFIADNCSPPEGEPPDSPAALAGLVDADIFIGDGVTYLNTNNPSSTKQQVTDVSGVLVLASDESTDFYVHNLEDHNPPVPEETATPTGTAPSPTATATGTVGPTPTATATGTAPAPTATATATSGPPPLEDFYNYLPFFVSP